MNRAVLSAALIGLLSLPASGAEKVYKHDQFPEDIATAAQQISGIPLATQPGFAQNEAFGQLYTPDPADYPVRITAIEMFLAGPPEMASGGEANAMIEIWPHDAGSAEPNSAEPLYSASTADLYNPQTGDFGMPLVGNSAFVIQFDWQTEDHPPEITEGAFSIIVRYTDAPQDLSDEWGTYQCTQVPEFGLCGCQQVGTIHDQATTSDANIFHIIYPPGNCSGSPSAWLFIEDIGVTGDLIMRARAEVASCTPDCEGRECGDNGCGGSCGLCEVGYHCDDGHCVPDTGCTNDDDCEDGYHCDDGQCVPDCVPDCDGKDCGDDGCGGSCGDCQAGYYCADGSCTECTCDGKECGNDGCGHSCGLCSAGYHCEDGQCVEDCDPDCTGKDCGDDGCGGSCGTCNTGYHCEHGECVEDCVPDCAGKDCGPDGCGGTCGSCDTNETCEDGVCVLVIPAPHIYGISPDFGYEDSATDVSITGNSFQSAAAVRLGATTLKAIRVESSQLITATVPPDMAAGSYMLIVTNPDGQTDSLDDAFEVRIREPDSRGCGCSSGAPGQAWLLLVGLGIALALRERR
ncbi:MAG: IPT/TIG domain-containing protein [Deltaproteobacteria bacterium]|nr:IPT/TIG domain-containing protein [Deltaproteobacteria bacterium]